MPHEKLAIGLNAYAGLDPPYAQPLSTPREVENKVDACTSHRHSHDILHYPDIEEIPITVSPDKVSRQRGDGGKHRPSDEAAIPTADRLTNAAARFTYEQATNIDITNQIENEAFEAESVTVWPKEGMIPR